MENVESKKNNTKFSVIVPIYNPPIIFLKTCIESILEQTLKDIEIILILDGSNKEIQKICEEYKMLDKRIEIINQENKGEGYSRNLGIKIAKSNWIVFVDADDWIEKDILEKIDQKIQQTDKKTDIISFDCYVEYNNKTIKNVFYNKEGQLNNYDIKEIKLQNIGKGITKYFPNECSISVVWGKIYRKKFIIENELNFKENIKKMPDAIFNIWAFEKAQKISHYNIYGYHYRKNTNSITQNFYEKCRKDVEIFLGEVAKYIKIYNKDEDYIKTYNIATLTSISDMLSNYYVNSNNKKQHAIIKQAYLKYKKADIIIFYVQSKNSQRKIKKIHKGKILWHNIMKARTDEITFKINKIKEKNIKFDEKFGPGGIIKKGEEIIFLNECIKNGLKVYSFPKKIGHVENKKSTWFKGFNRRFFYDQGKIFKKISPKYYKILVIQYIIRKYALYRGKYKIYKIYKIMINKKFNID